MKKPVVQGVMIGLSMLMASTIPIATFAWFDLSMRKARGEFVKDKDVRKHRTDILRLQAQIVEGTVVELADPIKVEMRDFLAHYETMPLDLKAIGVPGSFGGAIERIKNIFGI